MGPPCESRYRQQAGSHQCRGGSQSAGDRE